MDDPRFPGKFGKVSQFRGSRTIYIYKPYEEVAPVNYKLSMKTNIGGLGLKFLGSSKSSFDVTFEKNVYYPGEKIAVIINCDNSKCSHSVKNFKIKLYRRIRYRNAISGHFEDTLSLVSSMKEKGCEAGKKDSRHI